MPYIAKDVCKNGGHPWTLESTAIYWSRGKEQRRCIICRREADRHRKRRSTAAQKPPKRVCQTCGYPGAPETTTPRCKPCRQLEVERERQRRKRAVRKLRVTLLKLLARRLAHLERRQRFARKRHVPPTVQETPKPEIPPVERHYMETVPHTTQNGHMEEKPLPPPMQKRRECLRCEKFFMSVGPHNRICPACREALNHQSSENSYPLQLRMGRLTSVE